MNNSKLYIAFFGALLLAFAVLGCQQDSPVSAPISSDIQQEVIIPSTCMMTTVTAIPLPKGTTMKPVVSKTVTVTPLAGGVLDATMSYISATTKQIVKVHATLTIPPGAVTMSKAITMTIDTSVVGVQFAPKGLKFVTSSYQVLEASGLEGIASGTKVGFYYFDDCNNAEPELYSSMVVAAGSIVMRGGWVPHFSRYAFGR